MSRRIKITRNGKEIEYTEIPMSDLHAANKRIAEEMKPIIREHNRKQAQSMLAVQKLIFRK